MIALNTLERTDWHTLSRYSQTNWTRARNFDWFSFSVEWVFVCVFLWTIYLFLSSSSFCLICSNKIMFLPALNLIENTEKSQSSPQTRRDAQWFTERKWRRRAGECDHNVCTCCSLQIYIKLIVDYDLFHFECNRT